MRWLMIALGLLLLAGCGAPTTPPEARPATATVEPTPVATTPQPVATTQPTAAPTTAPPTPRPSRSPTSPSPTARATPTPAFQPTTQRIGPIRTGIRDAEEFTVEVTLTNVRFLPPDQGRAPQPGHTYLIIEFDVRNLGPASLRGMSVSDYHILDANGARRPSILHDEASACRLWQLPELLPGGRRHYCLSFQAPVQGQVEFVYLPLPYAAEGVKPGRHLAFPLRNAGGTATAANQATPAAAVTPAPAAPAATQPALALPATKQIGPVPGLTRGQQYTIEVTLHKVWYWRGDRSHEPKPGHTYVIVDVEIKNLGPASILGLSGGDFMTYDADMNVDTAHLLTVTDGCRLEAGEILPGGRRRACFGYEVPVTGKLEFVHVPAAYRQDSYRPDRHLSFLLAPD